MMDIPIGDCRRNCGMEQDNVVHTLTAAECSGCNAPLDHHRFDPVMPEITFSPELMQALGSAEVLAKRDGISYIEALRLTLKEARS